MLSYGVSKFCAVTNWTTLQTLHSSFVWRHWSCLIFVEAHFSHKSTRQCRIQWHFNKVAGISQALNSHSRTSRPMIPRVNFLSFLPVLDLVRGPSNVVWINGINRFSNSLRCLLRNSCGQSPFEFPACLSRVFNNRNFNILCSRKYGPQKQSWAVLLKSQTSSQYHLSGDPLQLWLNIWRNTNGRGNVPVFGSFFIAWVDRRSKFCWHSTQ